MRIKKLTTETGAKVRSWKDGSEWVVASDANETQYFNGNKFTQTEAIEFYTRIFDL